MSQSPTQSPIHPSTHPSIHPSLSTLPTEQRNAATARLDQASSLEICRLMNAEDRGVAEAVSRALPAIAHLVDHVVEAFRQDGRLFYAGAGTSGRLAMLDAAECPPTFGVSPEMVQCLMAGGSAAFLKAVEGAEDNEDAGAGAVTAAGLTERDVLVGIAASGRTPFVLGAIREAKERGAWTAAISNADHSPLGAAAHLAIDVNVGPEALTGSTRLKAGTAQKMILNMISTAAMVRIGKAYGNLMVDVQVTNEKLRDRARRIVSEVAAVNTDEAATLLEAAGGSAKVAIVMSQLDCHRSAAVELLRQHGGSLRAALASSLLE